LKRFAIISTIFIVGVAVGFRWSESRYSQFKGKLTELTEIDFDEYLRLKNMEEKYRKADEILGKAILLFLADLGLKISEDKVAFAKKAVQRSLVDSQRQAKDSKADNAYKRKERLKVQTNDQDTEAHRESLPEIGNIPTENDNDNDNDNESKDSPSGIGFLTGKVNFRGVPPARELINMRADPACVKANGTNLFYNEDVVVNPNGTLANVFVYVKAGIKPGMAPPVTSEPVVLDLRGCNYIPHVLGIRAGQTLRIVNSDSNFHNVHTIGNDNPNFNLGMPTKGQTVDKKFANPEVMVRIKCDVNRWMNSYAGVLDHPYFAVTDTTGAFSIKGLPPGAYTIEAWHEKFGTKTKKITVETSGSLQIPDFVF